MKSHLLFLVIILAMLTACTSEPSIFGTWRLVKLDVDGSAPDVFQDTVLQTFAPDSSATTSSGNRIKFSMRGDTLIWSKTADTEVVKKLTRDSLVMYSTRVGFCARFVRWE